MQELLGTVGALVIEDEQAVWDLQSSDPQSPLPESSASCKPCCCTSVDDTGAMADAGSGKAVDAPLLRVPRSSSAKELAGRSKPEKSYLDVLLYLPVTYMFGITLLLALALGAAV